MPRALSYFGQHVADDHDVSPGVFDARLGERGRGQRGQTVHLARQIAGCTSGRRSSTPGGQTVRKVFQASVV